MDAMTIRAILLRLFRRRSPLPAPPLVPEIAPDEPRYWRVYRMEFLAILRGEMPTEEAFVEGFDDLTDACVFCIRGNRAARIGGDSDRYCIVPPGREHAYLPRRHDVNTRRGR